MKTVEVWDKISPINGISAKEVIDSQRIGISEEIFLVFNGEKVEEIQSKNTISSNYNIDSNLSCEEVAQKYLEIKKEDELKSKEYLEKIEQDKNELEMLKIQNAKIIEELALLKQQSTI